MPRDDLVDIDQNRLDEEWLRQPRIFYLYAKRLADAKRDYEQAKVDRDVVDAELDRDIRSKPETFGITGRATNEAVNSMILLQPDHQEAIAKVLASKHQTDLLQAAVDALDHRKKALEGLVHLFSLNYYAPPKSPQPAKERLGRVKADAAFGKKKVKRHAS